MSTQRAYFYKVELVALLVTETGRARYTIEKVFDRLEAMGKIHPTLDPLDKRRVRVPMEEVDVIREALQ